MNWWRWNDQPTAQGKYLCCWGVEGETGSLNLYEVHYFDGDSWRIPHTRVKPNYYTTITPPQEENMLRELNEML